MNLRLSFLMIDTVGLRVFLWFPDSKTWNRFTTFFGRDGMEWDGRLPPGPLSSCHWWKFCRDRWIWTAKRLPGSGLPSALVRRLGHQPPRPSPSRSRDTASEDSDDESLSDQSSYSSSSSSSENSNQVSPLTAQPWRFRKTGWNTRSWRSIDLPNSSENGHVLRGICREFDRVHLKM